MLSVLATMVDRQRASELVFASLRQMINFSFETADIKGIAGVYFPEFDANEQTETVFPIFYQIALAILVRFPYLTKYPNNIILTPRESEILQLTAAGKTEAVIATELGSSKNTVRNHMGNAKDKLNASNKTHVVSIALIENEIHPLTRIRHINRANKNAKTPHDETSRGNNGTEIISDPVFRLAYVSRMLTSGKAVAVEC